MTAPPATLPPCQHGYKCTDHDRRGPHKGGCPMSQGMTRRRSDRIDALTPGEMRTALTYLSGWTPAGTDCALDDADELRAAEGGMCPQCRGLLPGHQLTCPLIPAGPEHPAGARAVTP